MKRLLFVFFAVLALTACEFVADDYYNSDSNPSDNYSIVTPSSELASASVESAENAIFKIDATKSGITISSNDSLGGKSVYYAVVNTSSKAVPKEYSRFVSEQSVSGRNAVAQTYEPENSDDDDSGKVSFHDFFLPEFEDADSRAAVSESFSNSGKILLEAGKTSKKIFVRIGNAYSPEKATLYAFNDVCNVWILDGDAFISTETQKYEIAETCAKRFESIYPVIRNVFGEESDSIYTSTSGRKESMDKISETGTKVNIVLYDIWGDGFDGGTIGLFSSMDYYKNGLKFRNLTVNRSNEGKYLYLDSFFADKVFDYTLSTLVHEFQHMINFGVKAMNGLTCDTNLNEMLSMLCEDMMQNYLGIGDEYSPRNRIKTFIKKYYSTGIRNYDESLVAYANAYIFGAWLTREFGGAALVKEMMSNKKSNNDCIEAAVSKMAGKTMEFNDIFAQFVKAVFTPESSAFVKDADESLAYDSYTYPMKGFANFECPAIFANLAVSSLPSSYGIVLKKYGEIADGETSVKLNFASESGMTASSVLVYVCIK